MKIAVASQNQTSITGHVGHCLKFWVFETNETEILAKTLLELSPEQSFHNSSLSETHPLDDVQVLISGGMGKNLVRRLANKGIEGIITKETDIDKAVTAYLDGSLVKEAAECGDREHQHRHEHRHGNRHGNRHEHRHQHRHQHQAS